MRSSKRWDERWRSSCTCPARPATTPGRAPAHAFSLTAFAEARPDWDIDVMDLWRERLPEFSGPIVEAKYARMKAQAFNDAQRDSFAEAERMAVRLALADRVLISTPMWNFSIPYKLKQWFDIIVQPGLTFRFDPVAGVCPAAEGPADHRHPRQWQRFRHRNEPRAHRHGNALPARNFAFCRYQQCPFRSDRTNHRTATAH